MAPRDDEIEARIAEARGGDAAAFERLVGPRVDRLLLRIELRLPAWLRPMADSADILQDTLLEAFRSLDRLTYRGPAAFEAWLLKLADRAVSRAAAHHGARKRGARATEPLSSQSVLDCRASTPSSIVVRRERAERIREAVRALPEDYHRVILLRVCDGLPVADVARTLERSEGSIRMLTLRALERLRKECGL